MTNALLRRILAAASAAGVVSALALGGTAAANTDLARHGMGVKNVKAIGRPNGSKLLTYHGGAVSHAGRVYVVYWGAQWSSDPSGEAAYLERFLSGVGSHETWSASTTQYCSGVATGTSQCGSSGNHVTQPSQAFAASWSDNASAAPSKPSQSQLAAEAVRTAQHFGLNSAVDQVVVATATGNNASGFGSQYCAWHSSTSYNGGSLAYTNLPYITDAGGACGANFVNAGSAGALDGVSIVEGHEYAETVTDMFPNSGWLDGGGAENGDKCAWISSGQGAAADISLSTGSFAVQSLWSNNFNSNRGGCVVSYNSATSQG